MAFTDDVNKMTATVLGAVFALIGILGFFSDPVLGYFETSLVHNVVHLASGAALLALAFLNEGRHARMGLLVLGLVYALVAVLGFVSLGTLDALLGGETGARAANDRDNFLHLALAVVLIVVPLIWKADSPAFRPARV